MNIIENEIFNVLSDGKWHSATDIINKVCSITKNTRTQVNTALHAMSGRRAIMKEREDTGHRRCQFRIGMERSSFGVSSNLSMFDNLLKAVRVS